MRVSTAFNRVLALPGASVRGVSFIDGPGGGMVVEIAARRRRYRCPCGWSTAARYDLRRRRWRHLDLAGQQLWIEAVVARIDCHACETVRTEDVAWARPGARNTTAVEDMIVWLAQRMDKSAVADLMRVAWRTVDEAVQRVVAEHLDPAPELVAGLAAQGADRLDGLVRIGVDEISYRRGHAYLTVVADHDTGRVVWVSRDRSQEAFEQFTTALGPDRCELVEAISMDMSPAYRAVAARTLPNAEICFDAFHVIKMVNAALDDVFAQARSLSALRMPAKLTPGNTSQRRDWRTARFLLRAGAERLPEQHRQLLRRLRRQDKTLARAWELKEGLRDLFKLFKDPKRRKLSKIEKFFDTWCDQAISSRIPAFVSLAGRVRRHRDGIIAAVHRGLSNSRLEGINAKIRVIQRRGYGHTPEALIAMIHLCLGGIHPSLPTRT